MTVDQKIFDSLSEFAFQDVLIDVAAAVAATEPDRASGGNDSERIQCCACRKFPPEWQTWSAAGII
jgi:hypothetical protein